MLFIIASLLSTTFKTSVLTDMCYAILSSSEDIDESMLFDNDGFKMAVTIDT